VLILATSLDPEALGGEVFRRRLGHKVRLGPIGRGSYEAIWRQYCERRHVGYDPAMVRYAIEELHARDGVALLPCHPGDLLSLMLDQARYAGGGPFTTAMLDTAWATYFPDRRSPAVPPKAGGAPASPLRRPQC
jgi:hypothetical protein